MHSVRQFELVKALATYRHFGRAAAALGVSQPALTRSLKHLEDVLGVPLFDRQGVTPTVFGELMLNHGEPVIKGFADLMREIDLAKGLEIGEFSVSAGPYPAEISAQRAIGMLSSQHPRIFVELKLFNWTKIVNQVLNGRYLGVMLFDRQGVTPTVFGELMLNHGEGVIKGFADLLREIDLAKGLEIGEFSVSAGPYPAEISGQRAIGRLSAQHPRLFVELKLFNWTKIVNQVLNGRIDLGFADLTEAAENRELETEAVRTSRLDIFCAAGHPLAGRNNVTLEELCSFHGSVQRLRTACGGFFPRAI